MPARALIEFAAGALPPVRDDLDLFTRAYIGAALELMQDEDKVRFDGNPSIENVAPATLKQMVEDCRKFQEENAEALAQHDAGRGGTDFFLTRSGHGSGYWDGGWGDDGDRLTAACKAYGEPEIYVGDDNLIYQMGAEGDWQLRSLRPKNAAGGLIDQVKVTNEEPPADPDAPTFSIGREEEDEDDMRESAGRLVTKLLKEDEWEGGAEVEDVICPACQAEQPDAQARLGGLGSRVHYRCRYCGWDWSASKMGPAWGNSPGD